MDRSIPQGVDPELYQCEKEKGSNKHKYIDFSLLLTVDVAVSSSCHKNDCNL